LVDFHEIVELGFGRPQFHQVFLSLIKGFPLLGDFFMTIDDPLPDPFVARPESLPKFLKIGSKLLFLRVFSSKRVPLDTFLCPPSSNLWINPPESFFF
jgi:hypothetical protein